MISPPDSFPHSQLFLLFPRSSQSIPPIGYRYWVLGDLGSGPIPCRKRAGPWETFSSPFLVSTCLQEGWIRWPLKFCYFLRSSDISLGHSTMTLFCIHSTCLYNNSLIFLLILCDGWAALPVLPGWFFLWHPLGSFVWQHSADKLMRLYSGGTVGLSLHILFHPQRG